MKLESLRGIFSICKLDPRAPIPAWATLGNFYSISRTQDELSLVCAQSDVPEDVRAEKNWRCLRVNGPLDFDLTGILASLTSPLAAAQISIFAISTFDTDYLLIKQNNFERAVAALQQCGHEIMPAEE